MKIFRITFLALILANTACAQSNETKNKELTKPDCLNVDYSAKSNILNPDTLKGDQKKIFWHFVKLSSSQTKDYEPLKVKAEFKELGITTSERARFVKAYTFFDTNIYFHKKSCEQWESFKDLAPKLN